MVQESDVNEHIQGKRYAPGDLLRAVDRVTWVGRAGTTDRAVFSALMQPVQFANSDIAGASVRHLAQISGRATATVVRSLHRLQARGLVRVVKRGTGEQPTVYQCLVPQENVANEHIQGKENFNDVPDAWRGRGLPVGSYYTWLAIPVGSWLSVAEITDRLPGSRRATIRQHLRVLLSAGLVDHPPVRDGEPKRQLWTRRPRPALARLAAHLGAAGHRADQNDYHQRQRAALGIRLGREGDPSMAPVDWTGKYAIDPLTETEERHRDYAARLRREAEIDSDFGSPAHARRVLASKAEVALSTRPSSFADWHHAGLGAVYRERHNFDTHGWTPPDLCYFEVDLTGGSDDDTEHDEGQVHDRSRRRRLAAASATRVATRSRPRHRELVRR